MGLHVARCYGHLCEATGAFRLPDAVQPQWGYSNMADTMNATMRGGINVPHRCLSVAKVVIISDTCKLSAGYFLLLFSLTLSFSQPYSLSRAAASSNCS